jgi:hypothetical protein
MHAGSLLPGSPVGQGQLPDQLWARVPNSEIQIQVEQSRALEAGLGGDARSGVTKDEAKTFTDQSVAALAVAFKLGWALPSELKQPDIDALRDRPDFLKPLLLAGPDDRAQRKPSISTQYQDLLPQRPRQPLPPPRGYREARRGYKMARGSRSSQGGRDAGGDEPMNEETDSLLEPKRARLQSIYRRIRQVRTCVAAAH